MTQFKFQMGDKVKSMFFTGTVIGRESYMDRNLYVVQYTDDAYLFPSRADFTTKLNCIPRPEEALTLVQSKDFFFDPAIA